MVDFINGYNSFDYSRNYLNNYAPMLGNSMYMQYGQNSYMQTPALFNYQAQDNISFGNSQAPIVNMNSEEKKTGNNALLIVGGLALTAVGIIFRKNISKALGFGKEVAKDSKGLVDDVARSGEKAEGNPFFGFEPAAEHDIVQSSKNGVDNVSFQKTEPPIYPIRNQSREKIDYYQELKDKGIKIQAPEKQFAPHNYVSADLADLNITTRTPFVDYRSFELKKGEALRESKRKYSEPFNYLGMSESMDADKTLLVVGKDSEGRKVLWLQANGLRNDYCGSGIRNEFVFTAPQHSDFTKTQQDLIKGIYGKSQEVLSSEGPLSRAVKVLENVSKRDESLIVDQDILLREINHYAQGQTIPSELAEKLKKVDALKNGEYIRLWG